MRVTAILGPMLALSLLTGSLWADERFHVVAPGHTLGKIAKRYNVTIEQLCEANNLSRRDRLKLGQKLIIPDRAARSPRSERPEREAPAAEAERTERAPGGRQTHRIESGHTLIDIAQRYSISVDALCAANGIDRDTPIRAGDELIIPAPGEEPPAREAKRDEAPPPYSNAMQTLPLPGAPPAYYYEPTGPGRKSLRPVIMYLHGRGANPQRDCARWARVARRLGWVVCPSGPDDRGGGARSWNNNWTVGHHIVRKALDGLREKYGRRVQLYGNTIVGFSEGAFVAMNVGVREPRAFNRWLILAADSDYWGGSGVEALQKRHATVRRVYLITGKKDGVANGTDEVSRWLHKAGVPTRTLNPADMGHELALERKPEMYRAALVWLQRGSAREPGNSDSPVAQLDRPAP